MKKIFLLFLLTFFLWGGISFAADLSQPTSDYCNETGCTPSDKNTWGICKSNAATAKTAYEKRKKKNNEEIKKINETLKKALTKYTKCRTDILASLIFLPRQFAPLTEEAYLDQQCDKDSTVTAETKGKPYSEFVQFQKAEKADYEANTEVFRVNYACATKTSSQALLEKLSSDSGQFDIGLLNVGKESDLNIVDLDTDPGNNILNRVLKLLTQVIGTFAVLLLIIGAYYMITSQGEESQLQTGKNIFFYTIVGLLIAFMSFIAVQFVISVIFTSTG